MGSERITEVMKMKSENFQCWRKSDAILNIKDDFFKIKSSFGIHNEKKSFPSQDETHSWEYDKIVFLLKSELLNEPTNFELSIPQRKPLESGG